MERLREFLRKNSKYPELYHPGLECQIMVAQDEGTKKGNGFSDGLEYWYHLRIIKPGIRIKYSIEKHAEAIGLSGWNYETKKSEWVGFDFDSVIGHRSGLSEREIQEIIDRAKSIPWIEIRKSTSGQGIHFYIFLDLKEDVLSRKEHQVLAKSILKTLSGLLGFDFKTKVDTCGGILWVWHRRGNKVDSFELVKPAFEKFSSIPPDWRNESKDFKGQVHSLVQGLKFLTLNSDQQKLLNWFANQKTTWWWDSELNMLVCHTFDLARAHKELEFKGVFYTNAQGNDCPNDQNCFAFPIKNGAWVVRRHTPGCKEHPSWHLDKSGWTYCYYNKVATLQDLAELFNGQENEKKEFVFTDKDQVLSLVKVISPSSNFEFPPWMYGRKITIRPLKGSKVSIKFERSQDDPLVKGWIANRTNFERVIGIIEEEPELIIPDNFIRHITTEGKDAGWYLFSKMWVSEPKQNISSALTTLGYKKDEIEETVGTCILNPWELVNRPFEPEYPGNRQWNKFTAKLMFDPKEGDWTNWKNFFKHIGKTLDQSVENNSWCQSYDIKYGWEYLLLWTACMFQYPQEPLPYIFIYGPQLCGKSSFHEAISLLVNREAVRRANIALTNPSQFNKELLGAILCVIEEIDLKSSKGAYNRIKDWVTSRTISIHEKGRTPFEINNTCHWLHCANNPDYCPVQFGDTRILMIEMEVPEIVKSKDELFSGLKEQASAMTYQLLNIKIPPGIDRLRIPVLETTEKQMAQIDSANLVERFISERCYLKQGHAILYSDFCLQFLDWLRQNGEDPFIWTNVKIGRSIPLGKNMPIKGRFGGEGQLHLGNITFDPKAPDLQFVFYKERDRLYKRTV